VNPPRILTPATGSTATAARLDVTDLVPVLADGMFQGQ
jgi:hypothetical protein